MKNNLFGLIFFFTTGSAVAQTPVLVKDFNPGMGSGILNSKNAAVAGSRLVFSAAQDSVDEELWQTDGTESGTVLVKDINAGLNGSKQEFYQVYNNQLYFTASTARLGEEL